MNPLRLVRFFLLLCLLAAPRLSAAPDKVVEVKPSEVQGTWEAWGCSLCWWAKVFGDRDDLADLFFTTKTVTLDGRDLPGLGMNYARYNAGACSWNEIDGRKMVVSKTILPYRQMEGFWLDGKSADPDSASWNWSADAKQRAMLLKARDRGANFFELFSNSPMWWMCANDNPSGAGGEDNLRRGQEKNHAIYMAAIAKRAKQDWGLTFTTVEPFNESVSSWWTADCKQEGCHFAPKVQAAVLPLLRAELDQRGLSGMAIAASDENTYDQAIATWKTYPPAVKQVVAQINVHGYQGAKGERDRLLGLARKDGKKLWNSEYGDGGRSGMEMARNLHLDFHQLRPTAWTYWQPLDGSGWGLIETNFFTNSLGETNPKYFVLAQYTRHIRPGMKIIDSGSPDVVAALDEAGHRLVLVALNDGAAKNLTFDLSHFDTARAAAARWVTETKASARYEFRRDVKLDHGRLECALPEKSVQTIEVRNLGR